MNQNIKTSVGVAIAVILIITVGVFAWQFGKKTAVAPTQPVQLQNQVRPQANQPQAKQKTNDITDWKTYVSDGYKFQFSYPADWTQNEEDLIGEKITFLATDGSSQISFDLYAFGESVFEPNDNTICQIKEITFASHQAKECIVEASTSYSRHIKITQLSGTYWPARNEISFSIENSKEKNLMPVFQKILDSFKFLPLNFCSDLPRGTAIGRDVYPVNIDKYGDIEYLGELFTASDCGTSRMSKIFGVNGKNYALQPDIRLKTAPPPELFRILQEIGFVPGETCQDKSNVNGCNHWTLLKTVPLNEILKLKPYVNQIKSSGCINCG